MLIMKQVKNAAGMGRKPVASFLQDSIGKRRENRLASHQGLRVLT